MKRGESGLSFVVGIDKPVGMTSHDVVNRCRRIFGEKRIGHTGTLDPLASGAMAVCVGPATKLSNYLTFHDKTYIARIVFGAATDTDDAEGTVIRQAPVPEELADATVAQFVLDGMCGVQKQLPPAYSAVKVGGVKSYEAARAGSVIDLRPREIEVHRADLAFVGRDERGTLFWDVRFEVSAGTYIRSLARDLGVSRGTCAHLAALRRVRSGVLSVSECVSLEALESDPNMGRLDPIRLLGCRYCALEDAQLVKAVSNGARLSPESLVLLERGVPEHVAADSCTPYVIQSDKPLAEEELVALLHENKLVAIYAYDSDSHTLKSRCGFAQGVSRGIV